MSGPSVQFSNQVVGGFAAGASSLQGSLRPFDNQGSVSLALQPHNYCSATIPLGASQTAMGKIVLLLLLIAICVALSYARSSISSQGPAPNGNPFPSPR